MNAVLRAEAKTALDAIVDRYRPQVEELLTQAQQYFIKSKKDKVTLQLPDISGDFWFALQTIASEEKWDFDVNHVLFRKSKVRISISPFWDELY